jgi:hypothetical protein
LALIRLNCRVTFNRSTFGRVEHVGKHDGIARALASQHIARRVNQQVRDQ